MRPPDRKHPTGSAPDRDRDRDPGRHRVLDRLRRRATTVLVALSVVAMVGSWAAVVAISTTIPALDDTRGDFLVRLTVVHLLFLGALVAAAVTLARRSTKQLEAIFDHEDQLVRSIAHEIRNPLSRMLVAADESLDGSLPVEEGLREMAADAEGLAELIDDLLETARVLTGAAPLPDHHVALDDLAEQVAAKAWFQPATTVVEAEPVALVGSARLIRLAVKNLVRNAAGHGYRGGPGTIELLVDAAGITVADRGPGVTPAQLQELSRDQPRALGRAQHGMGLAIASWVSEIHGGRLELDNRPGGGFQARLGLPTLPPEPDDPRTTATDGPDRDAAPG